MLRSAAFLTAVLFATPALAVAGADPSLFNFSTVHTVTNCNDSGAGSFRQAVEGTSGPRRVQFSVACTLTLLTPVTVTNGSVWIKGETAPSPGWEIVGHRLEIKKATVKVTHMRFRPGTSSNPSLQDAISVTGAAIGTGPSSCAGQRDMGNIILDHVSATWAQDENIQLWGCNIHNATVSNSIIAEGLKSSGHPDGDHSMSLIVGPGARDVLVHRNLFVSSQWRNPVLHGDSTTAVVNNWIHNPANQNIHVYSHASYTAPTKGAIIGNLISAGPSSRVDQKFGNGSANTVNSGSTFYLDDNVQEGEISTLNVTAASGASLVSTNPVPIGFTPISAYDVEAALVKCANPSASAVGPVYKDATDLRLIAEACARTGSLKNAPVSE